MPITFRTAGLRHEHKLTWDKVNAIRREYRWHSSDAGCAALGRRYGVSANTVNKIVRGRVWKLDEGDGNTPLPSIRRPHWKALSVAHSKIDAHWQALSSLGYKITP